MSNGECHVGAANAANIKASAILIKLNSSRIDRMETKQDWVIYLLITNLVGVVILLATRFI